MMKLILSKPFLLDGKEVTEIEADFENMTGWSVENAFKNVEAQRHAINYQEGDPIFHAAIFAESAGISLGDMQRLPVKDYLRAGREVRNFLYIESVDLSEEKTSEE